MVWDVQKDLESLDSFDCPFHMDASPGNFGGQTVLSRRKLLVNQPRRYVQVHSRWENAANGETLVSDDKISWAKLLKDSTPQGDVSVRRWA